MAEVGDLRVKLSLDNAQFDKSMASMNRTLQAMGQEIRGLQNKGKDWGASLDGLKQKQDAHSRLLEGQQTKVRKLAAEYEKAKQETGEHSAQTEKLAVQLNKASAEMNRTERELSEMTAEIKRQEAELAKTQSNWYKFGEVAQQAGEKLKVVGDKMKDIGRELSMKLTAPVTALGVGATKAAIDFESAFAGVRKTVDASEEEFQALSDGIRDMAKRMPTAATEIAAVGEAAGQLGIKKENILGFTETMVKLGTATNMGSDEAATALARLANITKMNQADFDKLGSAIVALGNNFATTESEITEMGLRLAGAGAQVGLSEADILGLSAALTSVGIQAEMGGSAFSRVMVNMQMATSSTDKLQAILGATGLSLRDLQMMASHSGKAFGNLAEDLGMTKKEFSALVSSGSDLESFASIAGMTGQEFKKAFESDAVGAIGAFVNGLGNAEEAGTTAINMLQEMGITEIQLRDALLRAGGAAELFGNAVETSNAGWNENNALNKEAEERYKTTASQLEILKNKIVDVAISFGETLVPMMMSVVDAISPIIDKFSKMDESTRKLIVVIGGIAAAIGPVILVMGMLISSVGTIASAFGGISLAIANAGGVMALLSSKLALLTPMFTALTGPVGIAVLAIGGIVTAMVVAYNKVEWFRDGVQNVFGAVKNVISNVMNAVSSLISDVWTKIKTFWETNGNQIKQATENVFNVIKTVVSTIMPVIKTVIDVAMTAIKFIVEGIWNAVKGIIEGVLNIILGLIKTFASVFTGDWKGLWEGVKQLLAGIVEAVWNLMQLMFYGRILKGLATFASSFTGTFTSLWTGISSLFTKSIDLIKNVFTTGFNAMKNTATTLMGSISSVISSVWNVIRTVFTSTINAIKNVFSNGFNQFLTIVKNTMNTIISTIRGTVSSMIQVGKDLISGLIKGIKEMTVGAIEAVTGVVDGVIDKAKNLLGIKSPSRVFAQIGRWISEGWAIGIEEKGNMVQNAVNDIALNAKDIAEHYVSEEKKLRSKANTDIAKIETDKASKIATIEKRMHEDVAKAQRSAASKKKKTTQDDALKIQRIREDAIAKIAKLEETSSAQVEKIRSTSTKKIVDLESEMNKTLLEETKRYIDDKKSLDQLNIIEEAQIWEQSMKLFAEGTKERVKAQQEYKKATETVNKEITAINNDFQGQINKVNEELIKQEETLTKAYEDAVNNRAKSLYSFKNLFDEFKVEIDTTGDQLLVNLGTQVEGFKAWQRQIELLSEKAIDKGLLAELREMGPNALPQLIALNSMTSTQLTQYSNLYKEKSKLARTQAETEMIGMKNDTDKQIKELRSAANTQLDVLQKEWNTKIKSLTKTTSTELSSLKQIGVDAGNGLLQGLSSTQGALQRKAQEIADSISKTIQSALKIKSPSRVMMGFGENVGEGLVIGMEDKIKQVIDAGKKLASAVTQPMDAVSVGRMAGLSSNNINNSRSYSGNTTINVYGNNLSPSEIARRNTQAQRQLAMEWGV